MITMFRNLLVCFLTIFVLRYGEATFTNTKTDYVALVSYYDNSGKSLTDLIPLRDQTAAMSVSATMFIYSVNGFDSVAGQVEIDCSIRLQWTDQSAVTFATTGDLLLSPGKIWKPELVLLNAMDTVKGVGDTSYKVRFDRATGQVEWQPRTIIKASCTPDVRYFPFDRQTCNFTYTPWGFLASEIDMNLPQSEWDKTYYSPSGVWTLISTSSEKYTKNNQSFIKFTLTIQREYLYFLFNVLLPVLLLSGLNGFVFLMPAESGERAGFCVTCFLSFVFLLQMTMSLLPQASEPMSLVCFYLVCMMAFSLLVSILTIVMLRVHHKSEKDSPPLFIQRVVRTLSCRTCRGCKKDQQEKTVTQTSSGTANTEQLEDLETADDHQPGESPPNHVTPDKDDKGLKMRAVTQTESTSDQKRSADIGDPGQRPVGWPEVGRVLDWFFFLVFLGGQASFTVFFIVPLRTQS